MMHTKKMKTQQVYNEAGQLTYVMDGEKWRDKKKLQSLIEERAFECYVIYE